MTWSPSILTWDQASKEHRALLTKAWTSGELAWKLNPNQFGVYKHLRDWESQAGKGRMFALDISRRWGKSTLMLMMAYEDAIKHPKWRIPYCAPTYKMVNEILIPLMETLTADCPEHLKPKYWPSKSEVHFENGSRIKIVGLDVNPDGARGTHLDRAYLDECGFFDSMEYLLNSILYPQMQMRKHARIYAGSTPPISPAHFWSQECVPAARNEGRAITRTIEDNPMLDVAEREEFIAAAGGRNNVTCRREYFCHHITDDTLAIIPEFMDAESATVRYVVPPSWRDCYVAMDPGWADLTAVLFGYWWFEQKALVIEDEVVASQKNSREIAEMIHEREKALWGDVKRRASAHGPERAQPYRRVSDNDHRLIHDLTMEHKLSFVPTQKDNLHQQINAVRVAIQQNKILIHPRCKILISHLKNGVWKNAEKKKFATGSKAFGHFDCVAALVYMWRNIDQYRNPYPPSERYVAGIKKNRSDTTGIAKPSKYRRQSNW